MLYEVITEAVVPQTLIHVLATGNPGKAYEILREACLRERKKFWLLPIIILLLLFGMRLFAATQTGKRQLAVQAYARITSYNVCYTKLLRKRLKNP